MDENEIRTEKDAVENMFDSLNECNLCGCIIKKNGKLQYYCAGCDVSKQKIILKQEEINTDKSKARYFETDLLVYEEVENDYIPRVVIEVKHRTFTTHDVITYTEKAKKHKLLYPYIQYGFFVYNAKSKKFGNRLLCHGKDFDFIFMHKNGNCSEDNEHSLKSFLDKIIKPAIKSSREQEKINRLINGDSGIQNIAWYRKDFVVEQENSKNYE